MENKSYSLFDNWHVHIQKMTELHERFGVLFTDLGITKGEVRIITFISSSWRGELRYYDSNGTLCSLQQYIKTNDKNLITEHLTELFGLKKEESIFTFDNSSDQVNIYDEFGMIDREHGEICAQGIIVEYRHLKSSSIIFELLSQISFYCKNVLDNENFEIEEYMLENIVHVALKKRIDVDLYNILASMSYEKKVPCGGILLVDGARQDDLKISFQEKYPFEIHNVKQIRKLLEMTTEKLFLVSDDGNITGLGDCGNPGGHFELLLFNGHQRWSYYKGGKELLSYKEGKYTFIFDKNINFVSYFPPGFIRESDYEHLNSLLHGLMQLKYGVLLIISDEAQTEVERLCEFGRGYAIKQVDLKQPDSLDLLSSITSIDGAIFIDTNLICYGVGMILDGIAVKTGLSSRGARYNSAQCYIDNKDHEKFAAVIVSDDETIDIIYNKKP
jgi:hypothetical protein